MLSSEDVRRVYDHIGVLQDTQAFYEDQAAELLLSFGDFSVAEAVFEFGCGTGRFARKMLKDFLSPEATYRAVDLSPRMVRLARKRLEPYSERASVRLSEGGPPDGEPPDFYDRFVSNYVFDLLPEDRIHAVLRSARRMLRPDGLLCLTVVSTGVGPVSRAVARAWTRIHARRPALLGGCRPIDLLPLLPTSDWEVVFYRKLVAFAITSEVVVAEPS